MSRKSLGGRASLGGGDTVELRVGKKTGGGASSEEHAAGFSFPKASTRDIMEVLHQLDVKISNKEFQEIHEHKELYRKILEMFAVTLTNITAEEINQPAFAGLSQLDNPHLHEDSIPNLNSFRAVSNLMKISGVEDFSMKDYIAPDFKRFKRHLSGIINYARYHEEQGLLIADKLDEREENLTRLESLRNENEKLAAELSEIREASKEEAKLIAENEEEVAALEVLMKQKYSVQEVAREDISELKNLNTSLKEGIAKRTSQVEDALATKKKLQSQIVSSPGRFKKQLEDSNWSLKQEEDDAKATEAKVDQLKKWNGVVEEAYGQVKSALDAMDEVRMEVEKHGELQGSLEEKGAHVNEKRHALAALDQNVAQVLRAGVRADEKLQHLRKQSKGKNTEATQAIEDLHKQILKAEKDNMAIKRRCEDNENSVAQAEREAEGEKLRMEQEKKDITQAFQRLEKSVVPFLRNIRNAVTEDSDPLNQSVAYV